jgi:hypothetical protein
MGYEPYPDVLIKYRNRSGNGNRNRIFSPGSGIVGNYAGNGGRNRFWNTASGIHGKFTRSDHFLPYVFDLGIE